MSGAASPPRAAPAAVAPAGVAPAGVAPAAVAPAVEVVCATRLGEQEFWGRSPLGLSMRRLSHDPRVVAHLAFGNRRGLPELYNARIDVAPAAQALVFVHDDVWLDDYWFADRVLEGVARYDVIGVAGNRRRVAGQPGWLHVDAALTVDEREHLSGRVAHGAHPFAAVSIYGPAPVDCELLDGVFLATRAGALQRSGTRFDPRFDFHFYDMDFCRTARAAGLALGTWPICLTHVSKGAFGTPAWKERYVRYRDKWGE